MKAKKLISLLVVIALTVGCTTLFTACSKDDDKEEATPTSTVNTTLTVDDDDTTTTNSSEETEVEIKRPELNSEIKKDTENSIGYQLEMPKSGDDIAIIHTSMGDITLRFFPENAPKAVENFITLSKNGKYDGTIFHRVINNFMIQTGDYEKGNGTGGKSIWGTAFEDEFCDTLYNIRGSVSMANSGVNTNGSQFFINQKGPEGFDRKSYDYDTAYTNMALYYEQNLSYYGESFSSYYPTLESFIKNYGGGINPLSYAVSEEVWKLYEENGGNIHLDGALRESGGHTVFAQVIDGMDVVDAIAAVEVNSENKPVTDIIIESVEITKY